VRVAAPALIAANWSGRLKFGITSSRSQTDPAGAADGSGNLLVLALLSLIVGAAAGFVGAIFRRALEQADRLRDVLIDWAHGQQLEGLAIVVAACAAATLVAASLGAASLMSRRC
jgi:hypothetical protein